MLTKGVYLREAVQILQRRDCNVTKTLWNFERLILHLMYIIHVNNKVRMCFVSKLSEKYIEKDNRNP
jgi:hypothetical protein